MIWGILHLAKLSILINGLPYGYFGCSRGVRQGNPLSPLLLCLEEEALVRWIDHEVHNSQLTVHSCIPRYLFYADDILIFLEVTKNCQHIQHLLKDYGDISGQNLAPENLW